MVRCSWFVVLAVLLAATPDHAFAQLATTPNAAFMKNLEASGVAIEMTENLAPDKPGTR